MTSANKRELQVLPHCSFLLKKFLNKSSPRAVFMIEGKRVVAGEAILSGLTTDRDVAEHSRAESADQMLEALVREHSRLVYRIAYAVVRSHHDAEDATQETFMRVLRYSSKLPTIENPKTWLARIAWRVAVDRSRKHPASREIPLDDTEKPEMEIASSDPAADETIHGARLSATLEKLIAALPTKLREPLVLSTIEEMTPREVAATLGINEAAARSRIFRARQMLKEKLAQRWANK
jgi:RNA polymerase sigma-70 factor (ECF subfamily)